MTLPPILSGRHLRSELLLAGLLLFAVIFAMHGQHIIQNWSAMHWEDQLFFEFEHEHIDSWQDCLNQPSLWPGLYRPLTTSCYYFVGSRLFQHRIEVYHTINILLYALNALLLYGLVRQFLPPLFALIAMLLFASRSAHAEVLMNTAEFQVLAATYFSLLTLLCFALTLDHPKWWLWPPLLILLLLALFSKETKLAVAPMLLLIWVLRRPRHWRQLWMLLVGTGGPLLFTLLTYRTIIEDQPTGFAYTTSPLAVWHNLVIYFWSFFNFLAQSESNLILPEQLLSFGQTSLGQFMPLVGFGLLLFIVCARRTPHAIQVGALGIGYFVFAALPYCILVDRLFMRYAYFSHIGLAIAGAAGVAWLLQRFRLPWGLPE